MKQRSSTARREVPQLGICLPCREPKNQIDKRMAKNIATCNLPHKMSGYSLFLTHSAAAVDVGKSEVLAMLGLFGAVWCSVLAAALEGRTILELHWDAKVMLTIVRLQPDMEFRA